MLFGKLAVTSLLIFALVRTIDLQALGAAVAHLPAAALAYAWALTLLQCALLGCRWQRIVVRLGGNLSLPLAMHWTAVGIFFNQALPSSIGGDVMRVWLLGRHGARSGIAVRSVLVERVTGIVTLGMLVSACAAWTANPAVPSEVQIALMLAGPGLITCVAAALLIGRAAAGLLPQAFGERVEHLTVSFATIVGSPAAGLEMALFGAAASLSGLAAAWVLGYSLGIEASLPTYIAFVGGAILLAVLPISIGGWGLREASIVLLFSWIGAQREPVLAMSLIWALLPIAVSAPFALVWALTNRGTRLQ